MKFHLSEEQELIQDSIRRTLEDACPPERRRAIIATDDDFDPVVWQALMELGVGGLSLPTEHGGSGLGLLDAALAMEIVGYQGSPAPLLGHLLAGLALAGSDNEAAKAKYLPGLADGSLIGAFAVGDGWEPASWTPTVSGNMVSGVVRFVGGAARAGLFVVGIQGGGLVAVESGEGVSIASVATSDPTRPLSTVTFANAPCTPLGDADLGQKVFDAGLVLLAADALGGAQRCLDLSVDYAKTREQFGVIIGQFQAVKHQLANMALEVEPARALVWYAAYAADAGLPDSSRVAAQAKAHLADRFTSVTRAAVQAHGGIGYTWEYDLQLWFRRALFDRAYLGAPSLHRERAAVMAGW
ncbi:MAG: acyl-CoA dehydrogenase [Caulobacter sp.]|nr:acyl-CoA dehydrogenase [Caulobacter sp.]